jgi:hypothetical protein
MHREKRICRTDWSIGMTGAILCVIDSGKNWLFLFSWYIYSNIVKVQSSMKKIFYIIFKWCHNYSENSVKSALLLK